VTEGVDEGPLVVQKGGVAIGASDTASSLYFEKLYELGVGAVVEAVAAIADGSATFTPQDEERASFQGLVDDSVARIDWSRPAAEIDRLIRGCDPSPGAFGRLSGVEVRLFGSQLLRGESGVSGAPPGTVLGVDGERLLVAASGGRLSVAKVRVGDSKKLPAAEAGIAAGARLD
jgi:methionyl-tRNA formyltransferase